ncbi:hypothetical protein EUX98_g2589 [Antrodiella citrinella]|uniref:Uncharacterized protein n=1 Tax=Antrodiella citrinella TaxID=2447956 RepID=A0A4S4MYM4_9APHY|nr:hypothetical protein EUX98_g2589 [Antrodiella citrinella]
MRSSFFASLIVAVAASSLFAVAAPAVFDADAVAYDRYELPVWKRDAAHVLYRRQRATSRGAGSSAGGSVTNSSGGTVTESSGSDVAGTDGTSTTGSVTEINPATGTVSTTPGTTVTGGVTTTTTTDPTDPTDPIVPTGTLVNPASQTGDYEDIARNRAKQRLQDAGVTSAPTSTGSSFSD